MAAGATAERARRAWLMPAGFLVAVLGLALATYSYTPPRTYEIAWAGAALLGFLLMFGGIVLAGHARARGGRRKIGKRAPAAAPPPLKRSEAGSASSPAPARSERSPRGFPFLRFGKRPASPGLALAFKRKPRPASVEVVAPAAPGAASAAMAPTVERFELACPRCATRFSATGARPLAIRCPTCDLTGTITGAATQSARMDVDLAPEPAPTVAAASGNGREPPLAGALERVSLQCPRCGARFAAEGARPLALACPSCGLTGTLR